MSAAQPVIGDYRIVARIDEGGMGAVYRAQHITLGHEVAIKVLPATLVADQNAQQLFRRGAASAAPLQHPNILPIYHYGEHEGAPYLVMPYISGGTLKERLQAGSLTFAEIVRVLTQLAAALDYAHSQGVLHRDVKPANLLLDEQGTLYLADFGIAKSVENAAKLTKTDTTIGTAEYMAPEQARGQADHRADLYAAGVILYEMLTGQLPFTGDSALEILMRHLQDTIPVGPLRAVTPGLPAAVVPVVLRALAKDPDARYQRGADLVAALIAALGNPTERIVVPPHPDPQPRPRTERRPQFVAAGLSVVALTAALLMSVLAGDRLWDRIFGPTPPPDVPVVVTPTIDAHVIFTVTPTRTATVRATTTPMLPATRTPSPTATRTPTPTLLFPNGDRPIGWKTYVGTAADPVAFYYPPDWTLDLSEVATRRQVTVRAPDNIAFVRIALKGRLDAREANVDVLRDRNKQGMIDYCATSTIKCQVSNYATLDETTDNLTFGVVAGDLSYTDGVLDRLRVASAVAYSTSGTPHEWSYEFVADKVYYGSYQTTWSDIFLSLDFGQLP